MIVSRAEDDEIKPLLNRKVVNKDHILDCETLMGIRQGNGAEPTIWAVISLVFFNVLREIGYGAILKVPFSNNELYIAGFGFVDSTDILQTGLGIDYY